MRPVIAVIYLHIYVLVLLSSPFVFARGVNIDTLYIALVYIVSRVGMNLYFKPGANALTDILFAIFFGVVAGYLYGAVFGVNVFGLSLSFPVKKACRDILNAPAIMRSDLGIWFLLCETMVIASYAYALIKIFAS